MCMSPTQPAVSCVGAVVVVQVVVGDSRDGGWLLWTKASYPLIYSVLRVQGGGREGWTG